MEHLGNHVFGQIALQVLQEAQQRPALDLGGDPPEHQLSSHGAWPPRRCRQATQTPEYHFKLLP